MLKNMNLFLTKTRLFLIIPFALSGCASTPQAQYIDFWIKNGLRYEDSVTIEAECRHKALNAVVASSQELLSMEATQQELIESCMKAKGFRWGRYTDI